MVEYLPCIHKALDLISRTDMHTHKLYIYFLNPSLILPESVAFWLKKKVGIPS